MKVAVLALAGISLVGCDCQKTTASLAGGDTPDADLRELRWIDPKEADWNEIQFGGEGSAQWSNGLLHLEAGVELTGTQFSGDLPEMPYELELDARKVAGSDFFCGLTFPVSSKDECLTFIIGGWGGGTVGISSIDGMDASENETTTYGNFEDGRWYAVRVVVEKGKLSAFIDGKQVVNVATEGRKLGLRPGVIEYCAPMGIAAWQTESEVKNFRWRSLAD
ncbi:DUF1080 domain-containing protein [Akkermansiaceae bacterium]|nr:DUF1080 domain-containing protein [bacterium]MDA9829830.1 DUF1080 domain-containing protein [Akkermansiaceae bacterium]MDB4382859.1 DUF1080 domain-containing protein [Akkermansiaceae bacterium]MDB4423456.1 DUF1080 domain-containing protein [bacterium]MDF1714900.1 DUF1080 domain-containing protein [Akkermansiaceae bacterium]